MSGSNEQHQRGGNESTNVQAGSVVIQQSSLSYLDVKNIALDVFVNNFEQLSQIAGETARNRAEEITEQFLHKLSKKNPDGLKEAENPDFQLALLSAQRAYAQTGDVELGNLLVKILVDRTNHSSRDVPQIILTESLGIVPKLTVAQIDALTVLFIFSNFNFSGFKSIPQIQKLLIDQIVPLSNGATKRKICYNHLLFTGCTANITFGQDKFGKFFGKRNQSLFTKGISNSLLDDIPELRALATVAKGIRYESDLIFFPFQSESEVRKALKDAGFHPTTFQRAVDVWKKGLLSDEEIEEAISLESPEIQNLVDLWNKSLIRFSRPTSVGTAIAHANWQGKVGVEFPLSDFLK